ncbi:MAG: patatin [Deltaproteobacteria bacterium]|nr:patatin [Deltaproteobacteria bacterium]
MQTLRDWLLEAPFSLGLSSGFFGFFAHAGFLSALEEEGLQPRAAWGSSAGALVGGAWAAGLSADEFSRVLFGLRRQDFWDPALGAGLLRGQLFQSILEGVLPARTFAQCRAPLGMSVFDVRTRRTRVLQSGDLATAIRASCAVPLLFAPVLIAGRPCLDGGLFDRPGLLGARPHERILHHHLASSLSWRRRGGPLLDAPRRAGTISVVLEGLPRVGPFRLSEGVCAHRVARDATRRILDRPLSGSVLHVPSAAT